MRGFRRTPKGSPGSEGISTPGAGSQELVRRRLNQGSGAVALRTFEQATRQTETNLRLMQDVARHLPKVAQIDGHRSLPGFVVIQGDQERAVRLQQSTVWLNGYPHYLVGRRGAAPRAGLLLLPAHFEDSEDVISIRTQGEGDIASRMFLDEPGSLVQAAVGEKRFFRTDAELAEPPYYSQAELQYPGFYDSDQRTFRITAAHPRSMAVWSRGVGSDRYGSCLVGISETTVLTDAAMTSFGCNAQLADLAAKLY